MSRRVYILQISRASLQDLKVARCVTDAHAAGKDERSVDINLEKWKAKNAAARHTTLIVQPTYVSTVRATTLPCDT